MRLLRCLVARRAERLGQIQIPVPDLALAPGNDDMAVSPGGSDMAQVNDMLPPPDLTPPIPSEADCFTDWKKLGNCPAPQITESYLGNNCAGTTGVFVVGRYFQSGNKFWTTNGFMPYGPYALPSKLWSRHLELPDAADHVHHHQQRRHLLDWLRDAGQNPDG